MSVPIKKWKGTKERVEKLLIDHPNMRDDLVLVQLNIWSEDLQKRLLKSYGALTFNDFVSSMVSDKLTPSETIRRTWQKLQQENANLRGKKYNERHNIGKEVTQKINE